MLLICFLCLSILHVYPCLPDRSFIVSQTAAIARRQRRPRLSSSLNFAFSNGHALACSRFRDHTHEHPPSVYAAHGVFEYAPNGDIRVLSSSEIGAAAAAAAIATNVAPELAGASDICDKPVPAARLPSTIISSEPLIYGGDSNQERRWGLLPRNTIVHVDMELRRKEAPPQASPASLPAASDSNAEEEEVCCVEHESGAFGMGRIRDVLQMSASSAHGGLSYMLDQSQGIDGQVCTRKCFHIYQKLPRISIISTFLSKIYIQYDVSLL